MLAQVAILILALSGPARPADPAVLQFTDVAQVSGVTFRHAASKTESKFLPETMGGGVAVFDFDNDGRLDLFFTNGARIDEKMTSNRQPDKVDRAFWNRLYRANGDGTFSDVTEKAGVAGTRYDFGAAVGDVDADGFQDLYVTSYGGNILYRNNGNGTFSDVTARAGVGGSGWSTSAGFFDYDNDGALDLFVCRYLTWSWENNPYCGERRPGYRAYCSPSIFKGIGSLLFRNNGDGTFADVSAASGIGSVEGKALGVAFNDVDADGWSDIFVANDGIRQFLFRNRGDGTFTETGLVAGVAYDENGKAFAGMGVDVNDYDNDGRPDVIVTDLGNERYSLFRNDGGGSFTYTTNTSGVGEATVLKSGWGTKFVDFDNDGLKDLFAAQSHVLDTIEKSIPALRYLETPLLLRNTGTRFQNVSATLGPAFAARYPGRGAAFGDLDDDGDVDVVMANLDERAVVLRNDGGNRGHWLLVHLTGTTSNRDGLGARIKVVGASGRSQFSVATTASSYLSASDRRVHFGLGEDTQVKSIEITWPSGTVQTLSGVKADQILKVAEPERARRQKP
jgi:hypothetical protein